MSRLLLALLAVAALGGCSTLDSLNPFAGSSGPKPAELTAFKASVQLTTLWKEKVGGAAPFVLTPAVVGDSVFAAAADGTVMRIDGGKTAWSVKAASRLSGGVGADGQLVVVGTQKGEVFAFGADGKPAWQARVSSEVLSQPQVAGDLVLVRSADSRIAALDARDGKRRWQYQRTTPALTVRANPGMTVQGDVVLAGFPGGKLAAIGLANGAARWESAVALPRGTTELERVADVTSAPAVSGSDVCAAAYQGRVACFDVARGNLLWARDLSSSSGVGLDARYLYATDDEGVVYAMDRYSGSSIWKNEALRHRRPSRPLVVGDYVLVGDYKGVVHLLKREDGAFAARMETDGSAIEADPRPLGDEFQAALVQTSGGGVYAIKVK